MTGCGSDDVSPTAPSPSTSTADVRGTWAQINGDTRTWVLDQGSIQVSGPASFQSNHPSVGAVSGRGGVFAVWIVGTLRFAETYESLDIPSRPSPNFCSVGTDGQLTASGNTMRGVVTETLGCGGVQVSQVTRDIVMQRR